MLVCCSLCICPHSHQAIFALIGSLPRKIITLIMMSCRAYWHVICAKRNKVLAGPATSHLDLSAAEGDEHRTSCVTTPPSTKPHLPYQQYRHNGTPSSEMLSLLQEQGVYDPGNSSIRTTKPAVAMSLDIAGCLREWRQ